MAEIRNAPLYFIIPLKKKEHYSQTQQTISVQGKQVVIALLDVFITRPDASLIDTLCKKAVVRFQENKGSFE